YFVDASPQAHLNYYPRGVVSIWLPYALGGVQIDKANRKISFNPVRVPCWIPLLTFADWSNGILPWADLTWSMGARRFVSKMGIF
ncbi:MAG: hypothetical protein JWN30_2418, partial [Bacilli bacterium]|nr:hypothetical protein [Bacilli bacterium]